MSKHKAELQPYIRLLEAFVERRMTAIEFEAGYIKLYLNDETTWWHDECDVLDTLFAEVDAFVNDPGLLDIDDIDEDELHLRAEHALKRLRHLLSPSAGAPDTTRPSAQP